MKRVFGNVWDLESRALSLYIFTNESESLQFDRYIGSFYEFKFIWTPFDVSVCMVLLSLLFSHPSIVECGDQT